MFDNDSPHIMSKQYITPQEEFQPEMMLQSHFKNSPVFMFFKNSLSNILYDYPDAFFSPSFPINTFIDGPMSSVGAESEDDGFEDYYLDEDEYPVLKNGEIFIY